MGFQLSPGVVTKEIDLTGIVPSVGTTEGGFAGDFQWGPINKIVTIANEAELVYRFFTPSANTFKSFFTAANFLSYGGNLKVVRSANTVTNKNATADGIGLSIPNEERYEISYSTGQGSVGPWAARYAGALQQRRQLGGGHRVTSVPFTHTRADRPVGDTHTSTRRGQCRRSNA